MTQPEPDHAPVSDDQGASPAPAPRKPRKGGQRRGESKSRRGKGQIDPIAPLHQARVFAMQALYEDDLTHHGLDEILQHLGEFRRRELVEFFDRIERDAAKAMETIEYLAHNADTDQADAALAHFDEAATRAAREITSDPENADTDLADTVISLIRARVEKTVLQALGTFQRTARKQLEGDLAAVAARPATPTRTAYADDLDDDPAISPLAPVRVEAMHRLVDVLAQHEKDAVALLMDLLRHTGRLARGVQEHLDEIDPHILAAAPAFPIPQLAMVDRAAMRIAIYELLHETDVPFKAVINEAVEIAKHYGGPNSGKFVNGVLRTISERIQANRAKAPTAST